jgi:hypothetical protein
MSTHTGVLRRDHRAAMAQVGWLGQTGCLYALADPPHDPREPGGYAPLYLQLGTWVELEPGVWVVED